MLYTLTVNGLNKNSSQEIQNLLITDQPHLVCLTETKLSGDVDDNLISIPGYSSVGPDRNNHGGGVIRQTWKWPVQILLNLRKDPPWGYYSHLWS